MNILLPKSKTTSCFLQSLTYVLLKIVWIVFYLMIQLLKSIQANLSMLPFSSMLFGFTAKTLQKMKQKKIIIIGGGFSGSYIATRLEDLFQVTLIDSKDYFEYTPSVLRTLVQPEKIVDIQVRHHTYLQNPNTKIVCGVVESLDNDLTVTLKNGESMKGDYVVVCTGSEYCLPFRQSEVIIASRGHTLAEAHDQLKHAKSCLVIGGGPTGVELAAEITTVFPDKQVILVEKNNALLSRSSAKSQSYAYNFLTSHGVRIVLGEHIDPQQSSSKTFITSKGEAITTDMAFLCTGIKPKAGLLEKSFSHELDHENNNGFVKVLPTLQLSSNPRIFVGGDVAAIKQEKLAQSAEVMAYICAENVKRLIQYEINHSYTTNSSINNNDNTIISSSDKSLSLLKVYKARTRPIVTSLGAYDGIFTFGPLTLCGYMCGLLKQIVEWKCISRYSLRVDLPF